MTCQGFEHIIDSTISSERIIDFPEFFSTVSCGKWMCGKSHIVSIMSIWFAYLHARTTIAHILVPQICSLVCAQFEMLSKVCSKKKQALRISRNPIKLQPKHYIILSAYQKARAIDNPFAPKVRKVYYDRKEIPLDICMKIRPNRSPESFLQKVYIIS
jgi:hypothetical protein